MIETYKIGATLTVKGDASEKMRLFAKATANSAKNAEALIKVMPELNAQLKTMLGVIENLAPKMAEYAVALGNAKAVMPALNKSFGSFNSSLSLAEGRTSRLAAKTKNLKENLVLLGTAAGAAGAGLSTVRGGRGGGGGKGGGGGGGKYHGHDIYGNSPNLNFEEAGAAGAIGSKLGMPLMIGAFGTYMLGKAGFKANERFQQAVAQYSQQGFGAAANNQAAYYATHTQIPGVSSTDLMGAVSDAITITRNPAGALALAPSVAKMEFANSQIYQQQGKNFTRQDEMRMLQFAEMRTGSTDPVKILQALNLIEQGYASDAARLTTNDLRTGGRQGSSFIHHLTDKAFAEMLPLYQSLGGQRTSTGLSMLQTSLFKGQNMKTGKRAVAELERLGVYDKSGKLKKQYVDQVSNNPIEFIHDTLVPLMAKKGITSDAQMQQEFSVLFTQTTVRVAEQIMAQWPRIAAQANLVPQAGNIQSNYIKGLNLPSGRVEALSKSWDSLMTAMGKFTSGPVISGIEVLTTMLNKLTTLLTRFNDADDSGKYSTSRLLFGDKYDSTHKSQWQTTKDEFDTMRQDHAKPVSSSGSGQINLQVDGRTFATILLADIEKLLGRGQYGTSGWSLLQTPAVPGTGNPMN